MESGNDQTFCLFLHLFRTLEISNKFSIFSFHFVPVFVQGSKSFFNVFFPMLGYLESFISTKDICVFTSTAAEAENVGQILNANCYFALVAHNFLPPHELDNIQRQWNTPHTTDTMPVLGMP